MTNLARCQHCGTKTSGARDVCPRCDTPPARAPVVEPVTASPVAHPTGAPTRAEGPLTGAPTPTDTEPAAPGTSVFDTDIGALFPQRRRFGVVDFLLLAGLVAWTVLASDLRLWVRDGLATFGSAAATAGVARPDRPASPIDDVETVPTAAVAPTATPENTAAEEPDPTPVSYLELMDAGNRAFDAGAFDTARARFTEATVSTPTDARAHNNLGQSLVRLGDSQTALAHFEEAVRLDPERWAYHFNLAHTLGELGWWNRAATGYRRAAEIRPEDHTTRYNLARALHERRDYRGAIENYLIAIRLAPDEPRLYLSIAKSYEAFDRPADAVTAYARYLDIEPASDDADSIRRRMEQLARPIVSDREQLRAP